MIRVDYKWPGHPKFLRAGTAAQMLWLKAMCHADQYGTGGIISLAELRFVIANDLPCLGILEEGTGVVRPTTADELTAILLREGSLEPIEGMEGLYILHDFHAYNSHQPPRPSRDDLAGWASARQARVSEGGFVEGETPAAPSPGKRRPSSAPPSAPRLPGMVNPRRAEAGRKGAMKRWGKSEPPPPMPEPGHGSGYPPGHSPGHSQPDSQAIASDGQPMAPAIGGSGSLGSPSRSQSQKQENKEPPPSERATRGHSQAGYRGHGQPSAGHSQSKAGGDGSNDARQEPESGVRLKAARPSPPPSETGKPRPDGGEEAQRLASSPECYGSLEGDDSDFPGYATSDLEGFRRCGDKLVVRGYTFRERYDSNIAGMAMIRGHLDEAELRGQERLSVLYSVCIAAEAWASTFKTPRAFDPHLVADYLNAHPDKRPARILAMRRAEESRRAREAEREALLEAKRREAIAKQEAEREANRPPTADDLEALAEACADPAKAEHYRERAREARAREADHKQYLAMVEESMAARPSVRKVERIALTPAQAEARRAVAR